ncbi:hypothetical protein EJB05_30919, partial [Eragrostis curvula]
MVGPGKKLPSLAVYAPTNPMVEGLKQAGIDNKEKDADGSICLGGHENKPYEGASVSHAVQNGNLPRLRSDEVEVDTSITISNVIQSDIEYQRQNNMEETVTSTTTSLVCNDNFLLGREIAGEEDNLNNEELQLFADVSASLSNINEGKMMVQMVAPVVAKVDYCGIVDACNFARNDGMGASLLEDNKVMPMSFGLSESRKFVASVEESNGINLFPRHFIVQPLMAPKKCHGRKECRSSHNIAQYLAPITLLKGKRTTRRKKLRGCWASCDLFKDYMTTKSKSSYLDENGESTEQLLYEENQAICAIAPSTILSGSMTSKNLHGVDARSHVLKLLQLFKEVNNVVKALKEHPIYTKLGPFIGNVPGVEIGDEFHYRAEMSIVGLHRPFVSGIGTYKLNGVPIAVCIVASGGYPNEVSSSDELIYTGSGGNFDGKKKKDEDQKLKRGNLALKNCMETKTPVRVIHGFKGLNSGEYSQTKGKNISMFTYDGLYTVVDFWPERPKGSMIFKYKLQRMPGQSKLILRAIKATRQSKQPKGLCVPDISQGRERIPIRVVNTIDDTRPTLSKYITELIYPSSYKMEPPKGCDCLNGCCSESNDCVCAVKNGGNLPFNHNGEIIWVKPLVYECGPSCRCPPTCQNRVSQHGIKIALEIFKTGEKGWGVRPLSSITSGSFICEYVGDILQDEEANNKENDMYLFDIGCNYGDTNLWSGLKSVDAGLHSSLSSSKTNKGFTIDGTKWSNVGRFINHSCSPNLYAQNVLWDHDDTSMPHVMLFAAKDIPSLQELTYDYNYTIGKVCDENGVEKVKHCYCGSSNCKGRLY